MRGASALLAGLLFGIGLAISGMTSPDKVIAFLDITGAWDPSLAFVMGAGLLVAAPLFLIARRRGAGFSGDALGEPADQAIDARLIGGSALFGLGWGISGLCPGPALIDLFLQPAQAGGFCAAMVAGLLISRRD